MILGMFKSKPLLDSDATLWLFDTFAWTLRNFDTHVFYHETILVAPSNQHFPGRESDAHAMANRIFEQVKRYAGLKHWACRLVNADALMADDPPTPIKLAGPLRGSQATPGNMVEESQPLCIPYRSNQLAKPEALIANFAHILAHYLAQTTDERPPGDESLWPHAMELLAVFMGFGLMIANSAYTFRGGCGSCYNPLAERTAFLSQDEATYALAIFCVLKDIPNGEVLPHLKSYLRPVFKTAVKEIKEKTGEIARLKTIRGAIAPG